MPLPYGWGTGGIQVTASVLGPDDVLKVIDQGADDTTNAVSIRRFFARVAGVRTTTRTGEATVIQTRHRIPGNAAAGRADHRVSGAAAGADGEAGGRAGGETRRMHGLAEYGLMQVKLYEDVAKLGGIAASYDYPVMVGERYLMAPSPIPAFDNPKMHMSPALQLFGARAGEADLCCAAVYFCAVVGFRGLSVSGGEGGGGLCDLWGGGVLFG